MNRRIIYTLAVCAFLNIAVFVACKVMSTPRDEITESLVEDMKPDNTGVEFPRNLRPENGIVVTEKLEIVLPICRAHIRQLHKDHLLITSVSAVALINFVAMLLVIIDLSPARAKRQTQTRA